MEKNITEACYGQFCNIRECINLSSSIHVEKQSTHNNRCNLKAKHDGGNISQKSNRHSSDRLELQLQRDAALSICRQILHPKEIADLENLGFVTRLRVKKLDWLNIDRKCEKFYKISAKELELARQEHRFDFWHANVGGLQTSPVEFDHHLKAQNEFEDVTKSCTLFKPVCSVCTEVYHLLSLVRHFLYDNGENSNVLDKTFVDSSAAINESAEFIKKQDSKSITKSKYDSHKFNLAKNKSVDGINLMVPRNDEESTSNDILREKSDTKKTEAKVGGKTEGGFAAIHNINTKSDSRKNIASTNSKTATNQQKSEDEGSQRILLCGKDMVI